MNYKNSTKELPKHPTKHYMQYKDTKQTTFEILLNVLLLVIFKSLYLTFVVHS